MSASNFLDGLIFTLGDVVEGWFEDISLRMCGGFAGLLFSDCLRFLPEGVLVVLMDLGLWIITRAGGTLSAPEVKSGEVQKGSVFVSLLRAEAVTLKGSAWST